MTSLCAVHLALTIVSLTLGMIIGGYGVRALTRVRPGARPAGGMPDGDREPALPPL